MDYAAFDRELSAAFCHGERTRRELRLSDEQAQYLAQHYPVALEPMGEQWYQVTFKGANQIGA